MNRLIQKAPEFRPPGILIPCGGFFLSNLNNRLIDRGIDVRWSVGGYAHQSKWIRMVQNGNKTKEGGML